MTSEHADERFLERHGLLLVVLLLVVSFALTVLPNVRQAIDLSQRLPR